MQMDKAGYIFWGYRGISVDMGIQGNTVGSVPYMAIEWDKKG